MEAPVELTHDDYVRLLAELNSVPVDGAIASEDIGAGEVAWMETADLWVDPLYQRPPRRDIIKEIGDDFRLSVCGLLAVNFRDTQFGQRAMVIDGQNRLYGAKRAGVEVIRCEVWRGLHVWQEADLFWRRNRDRSAVSALNQHRAEVIARKREALEIARITSGHHLNLVNRPGPGSIRAVAAVRDIYRAGGEEGLELVLGTCEAAFPGERHQWNGHVLRAVHLIYSKFRSHENFSPRAFVSRLKTIELSEIRRSGLGIAESEGMDFDAGIARKMYLVYNHGRVARNRLPNLLEVPEELERLGLA